MQQSGQSEKVLSPFWDFQLMRYFCIVTMSYCMLMPSLHIECTNSITVASEEQGKGSHL